MNKEILPCPFCGEKANTFHIPKDDPDFKWNYPGMWVIGCNTGMCMGNINNVGMIFSEEKDAVEMWNTRKSVEKCDKESDKA